MLWQSGQRTITRSLRTATAECTSTQEDATKETNVLGIMTGSYLKKCEHQANPKEKEERVMVKARTVVRQKDGNPKEKIKAKAKILGRHLNRRVPSGRGVSNSCKAHALGNAPQKEEIAGIPT